MYSKMGDTWKKVWKEKSGGILQRAIVWRKGRTITRLERPSRLDKARMLGYKAKPGFVVVRVRLARGGMRRKRPVAGRRPKHLGVVRIKGGVNVKQVAEQRVGRKFPNLRALNSYFVYRDGRYSWYEVIMVDPNHPAIIRDKNVGWVATQE